MYILICLYIHIQYACCGIIISYRYRRFTYIFISAENIAISGPYIMTMTCLALLTFKIDNNSFTTAPDKNGWIGVGILNSL